MCIRDSNKDTKEQSEEKVPQEKINTKQILKLTEETIQKDVYKRQADDENVMEMALIENIQREDLNSVEIALAYQHLLEQYGPVSYTHLDVYKRQTVASMPFGLYIRYKETLISIASPTNQGPVYSSYYHR